MTRVIGEAWAVSFTLSQIKASLQGAGLWPMDMERAMKRLQGTGSKRQPRPDDRLLLADGLVVISENEMMACVGPRPVRKLQYGSQTVTGEFLKAQEKVTRPVTSRVGNHQRRKAQAVEARGPMRNKEKGQDRGGRSGGGGASLT